MRLHGKKIGKNTYRIQPSQRMSQIPDMLDPPSEIELDYVRSIIRAVSKMGATNTDCVYTFNKQEKTFTVENLPCCPSNKFELWAFRILLCLRDLGYKATLIVANGNLPFDPNQN